MQVVTTHFKTTHAAQNQPHTALLHLDFVRRTAEGPALFTVQDIKIGRQTSTIHITLSQGGKELVVGTATNMNIAAESGISLPTAWKLEPSPPPVDLQKLSLDKDQNWGLMKDMPFAKFRKAGNKVEMYLPRKGQNPRSITEEWIRLSSGENWTNESLGFLSDMWPSIVESLYHDENPYDLAKSGPKSANPTARFWYPTLVLNLDIKKALPEEGVEWLFARASAKQVKNGRFDLEVVICDAGGELVALSHHCCLMLGADRNTNRSNSKI